MRTLGPSQPTLASLMAAYARTEEAYEHAHTALVDGPCRAHELARAKASDARHEARVVLDEAIAASTAGITTARGAIEKIMATILDRGIDGLTMAQDGLAKNMRDYAAAQGELCVEWTGITAARDYNNLAIVVTPKHHSSGHITLTVVVRFAAGQWFPQNAVKIAKLALAVSELALELRTIWDGKVLELGTAVGS